MSEVTPDKVILTIKDSKDKDAKPKTVELDSGFTLWSTGIGGSDVKISADSQPCSRSPSDWSSFCRINSTQRQCRWTGSCESRALLLERSTPWAMLRRCVHRPRSKHSSRQIHSDMLAHLLELWDAHDLDKDDQM